MEVYSPHGNRLLNKTTGDVLMKKRTLTARLISLWLVAALMLVGMPVVAQDHAAAPTTAAEPAVTDVAPAAETAAASSPPWPRGANARAAGPCHPAGGGYPGCPARR